MIERIFIKAKKMEYLNHLWATSFTLVGSLGTGVSLLRLTFLRINIFAFIALPERAYFTIKRGT